MFGCRVGMSRNASGVSLSDLDGRPSSPMTVVPKATLQRKRPHTGGSEFLGLTVPIDINMMFEVYILLCVLYRDTVDLTFPPIFVSLFHKQKCILPLYNMTVY